MHSVSFAGSTDASRLTLSECNTILLSIEALSRATDSGSSVVNDALRLLRSARSVAALCEKFRRQLVEDDAAALFFLMSIIDCVEALMRKSTSEFESASLMSSAAAVAVQAVYNACAHGALDMEDGRLASHVTNYLSRLCRLVLSLKPPTSRPSAYLGLLLLLLASSRQGSECLTRSGDALKSAQAFVRRELLAVYGDANDADQGDADCDGDRLLALRELLRSEAGVSLLMPECRLADMQPPEAQDCLARLLHLLADSDPSGGCGPVPVADIAWLRLLEHLRDFSRQLLCAARSDPRRLESDSALFFAVWDLLGRPLAHWQPGTGQDESISARLRQDADLARLACQLLHCVSLAGRANPDGPFAVDRRRLLMRQEPAGADPAYTAAVRHPGAAFKTALVRFLANAALKNAEFQQTVIREGGLEELLNCLALDDKNPCLRQWAALAVRNLCDGCPEAQDLLRRLRPVEEGCGGLSADSRQLLDECLGGTDSSRVFTVRNGLVVADNQQEDNGE